jgi:DNA-binding CsgD family transcriptional regulator
MRHLGDLPRVVQLVQEGLRVSVDFQDRRLLSLGAHAALWLVGDRADPSKRALLLGAGDALRQAAGFNQGVWERLSGESMATLREQLEREGLGVICRDGRSLSIEDTATLALMMLEDFSRQLTHPETAHDHQTQKSTLSKREQQVLGLVADGFPNKAIAQRLNISPATVSYHLTSVFNKLGAQSRAQAVALAFQRGLAAADGT